MNLKHILIPAFLCIFSAIVNGDLTKVDYCSDAYTCKGQREKHVLACNNKGDFHGLCPVNARIISMTKKFKQLFLDEHNKYRNEIAGGLKDLKPAAAMATLEWDDELAYFAEFNVKRCQIIYEDEGCFKTARYEALDQNTGLLFYKSIHDCSTLYTDIENYIRIYWYEQYLDCTQAEVDLYHPPEKPIKEFGKMVMDRNNRLGCGASLFVNDFGVNVLFTCNYARRLLCNKPIYRSGKKGGSGCKSGKNPNYPNLCSTEENVDPNNYK
ncbi:venom allergen-1-like [Eurosta solidaginis]|uniref:venom allergen-1-like n=1 Tax=Eurosta solidaginis TaxID=178769 RepID=UPI0035315B85